MRAPADMAVAAPVGNATNGGPSPIRILDVELADGLADIEQAHSTTGALFQDALVLVRLHSEPLDFVEVRLPGGRLSAADLTRVLEPRVLDGVREHLARDQLPAPTTLASLTTHGDEPRCLRERTEFLRSAPPITVVIPSRERPERLRRCVDSILASEYPRERFEVLVVDNAPVTDATRALAAEYVRRGCRVRYAREEAPGSASARNRGLQDITTDLVAMTDDDVLVDRHWLAEVARTFATYPDATCVTGLLLPAELDSQPQIWFEQYGGFSRGFRRRLFDLDEHRPPDEPVYPWTAGIFGTGNNFSFRAAQLREVGGFDPALGNGTPALGGVDSEVLLRTILAGHTIVYEPRALVHHAHRPDYEALRRQVYAYGAGLTAYYLKILLAEPRLIPDFLRRVPAGLRFMMSPGSHVNKHKRVDYPSELTWIERRGMLYGPLAYARSRRKYGPHRVPRLHGRATPGTQPR